MAKKKSAKEASEIFHSIMRASVDRVGTPKNYDFSSKINGVQFHFKKQADKVYFLWQPNGGLTFKAQKNDSGNWEIIEGSDTALNARVDGLIKRYEEANKKKQ